MNFKILLAAVAMAALAGCAGNGLYKAEKVTPQGTDFDNELARGYLRLARSEQAEADYKDADYFAERAITASNALIVLPPEANARNIPEADQLYVLSLREELVEVLDGGARIRVPELAAAAQIAYECWIQELEENLQQDEIAACRDQLDGLIPALRNAIADKKVAAAPAAPPPPAMPAPPKGKTYTVFFPTGGIKLNADARAVVAEAAAHAAKYDNPQVIVSGYTDRAGSAAANQALSVKRARSVAAALGIAGVAESALKFDGYGEEFNNVYTDDGVAEAKNRRAEIQVAP